MNYVSFPRLQSDVLEWERQLPHFDAVCGVPRSGLLPATLLALRRNIRLVNLSDLLKSADVLTAIKAAQIRSSNPIVRYGRPYGSRLLIVDDSSSDTSTTFNEIRRQLGAAVAGCANVSFGAVYKADYSEVDYYFRSVPLPRMFAWNWFRHWGLQSAILDIDGVVCEDWRGVEKETDTEYLAFIENAKPLYIPAVPVICLVTGRLEKYRSQTEAWLARHGVEYRYLIMNQAGTPELRRRQNNAAELKANVYRQEKQATLFVESNRVQAKKIYEATGKPVLCIDSQEMFSE